LIPTLFTVGAEAATDGQELEEISGSSGDRTIRTSNNVEDENSGHDDALTACLTEKSAHQKTLINTAAAADDDDDDNVDVHIKDEGSGDTGLSTTQTRRLATAKDSASSSDDGEEANEDIIDDDDDDNEQVHSLYPPVDSDVLLFRCHSYTYTAIYVAVLQDFSVR